MIVRNGATLAEEIPTFWSWGTGTNTDVSSVAVANVTGGASLDIVTGGTFAWTGNTYGMIIVRNGATLTEEKATYWLPGQNTLVSSLAIGNLTGGTSLDIVTGGRYSDGTRNNAQVIDWNSATLTARSQATWFQTFDTQVSSVAIGNLPLTGNRIIAGGQFWDGTRSNAQITIWG
jgi:hypothetical protein